MIRNDDVLNKECEEYLLYLYELAAQKYGDHPDMDALIQETILVWVVKRKQQQPIEHPRGFLSAVMKNKYNHWLREKYRSQMVFFEPDTFPEINDDTLTPDETKILYTEYESVRRELGRLIRIYREVTVRHYIHGHSVERIAADLNISTGTVKSRLSKAREQIKEGLEKMEKYERISYEPKNVFLGIWGYGGMRGEPFSLIHSDIEGNILALAYEKPVRIRDISGAMGIPTAYIEPLIDTLIYGELMGRTDGGLVYTRCFMRRYKDTFGNIEAQEHLADIYAERVWDIHWKHIEPLTKREEFDVMSPKQKATLLLFILNQTLNTVIQKNNPDTASVKLPERPNGGKWLALATVLDHGQKRNVKYERSGPVQVCYSKNQDGDYCCKLYDLQSSFGNAHWAYVGFKYKCTLRDVLQFYASLLPCDIIPPNPIMHELIPDFEELGILTRKENGEIALDIPALTFEEFQLYREAIKKIQEDLYTLLRSNLIALQSRPIHRVPKHVDEYECFEKEGILGAFSIAQMLAIVKKGLLPYPVTMGKTPIIFIEYRKNR